MYVPSGSGLLCNVCVDFAGEWFGMNANEYELVFLYILTIYIEKFQFKPYTQGSKVGG